ncbi:zinc-ribbon domain-containing protein [Yoonia maritima]|uniref:zinc-ribbon domain-containing protein n=1 Tax=Yoonia maritima TaxID=1435347 RepID=UPI003736BEEB
MRLICPKCNAQYDIASDAIPEGGRDVQCSSCSHTWFQTEETPPAASVVAPAVAAAATAASSVAAEVESAVTKRKPLDSSIADILRQEAAREKAVEQGETVAAPAEDVREPALNRPAETVNADETRRRISMMAAEDTTTPATVAAAATGAVAADANLRTVPSIDEINEQLRARSQGDGILTESEQEEVAKRRGFRRGFVLMLLLLAILIAPYFFADQIVEQFPQVAEPMETYIETVDNLRLWLNEQFQTARAMIEGFTGAEAAPISAAPATDALAIETAPASMPTAPLD